MNEHLIFSAESPILRELVLTALSHTPWLSCDTQAITIDWGNFLDRFYDTDSILPLAAITPCAAILEELIPALSLEHFAIRDERDRYPNWAHMSANSGHFSLDGEPRYHPLDDGLQKAIAELRKQEHQERAKAGRAAMKGGYPRPTDADLLPAQKNAFSAAAAIAKISKVRSTVKYSFYPDERFFVHHGVMSHFFRGYRGFRFSRTPSGSAVRSVHIQVRRLIRLHLDLLDALAVRREAPTMGEDPAIIAIIMRMGEVEGLIYRSISQIETGSDRQGVSCCNFVKKEVDRSYLQGGNDKISERELGELLQGITFEWFITDNRAQAKEAPLQRSLADIHERLQLFKREAEGPTSTHLSDCIDLLVSRSPFLSLLASGFLATYDTENYSQDKAAKSFGICIAPWVVTSSLCRHVTGSHPMTFIPGCQLNDDENAAPQEQADGESSSETDNPADQESGQTLGIRLWQGVMA